MRGADGFGQPCICAHWFTRPRLAFNCTLPRLALGVMTPVEEAGRRRIGFYDSQVQLHGPTAAAALGQQRQPSLAPPPSPCCRVRVSSSSHSLETQAGFCPAAWPWRNCSAWPLTDQLLGAAAAAAASGAQLPLILGVTCALGIATVAGACCASARPWHARRSPGLGR